LPKTELSFRKGLSIPTSAVRLTFIASTLPSKKHHNIIIGGIHENLFIYGRSRVTNLVNQVCGSKVSFFTKRLFCLCLITIGLPDNIHAARTRQEGCRCVQSK
jgi:hypothetical protein